MVKITRLTEAGVDGEGYQVEEFPADGSLGWTVLAKDFYELDEAIEHCFGSPHLVSKIHATFGCPFCAETVRQAQEKAAGVLEI